MNRKWVYSILFGLVCANLIVFGAVYDLSKPRFLEVDFFDVGQGDSIFIETQSNSQILIDGGPSSVVLDKLAKEIPFYDRDIDLIILTHTDQDHLFGLLEVLKRYKVKNILWTGIKKENTLTDEWEKLIADEGANIRIVKAGDRIIINENPFVYIDILHPSELNYKDTNDNSIVARLVFEKSSFLMTGDTTENTDSELLGRDLKTEVLKVAHHGSKDSTSLMFLENARPKTAIISVGENSYGHPNAEVLERLEKFGIEVLRTDEIGDIKMLSDGNSVKIYIK